MGNFTTPMAHLYIINHAHAPQHTTLMYHCINEFNEYLSNSNSIRSRDKSIEYIVHGRLRLKELLKAHGFVGRN